ncbi:MAG: hypothetical protein A3J24_09090 [Deltaproteobacteria bacterium RIFCSPLOWO2_02_FULL_53_8]|nr:MAG: hypothetical protein A3J24_09090 [Deltaproteobacteria bacterium RIFCSPLOWO2_02_FULL_53_8]
MKSSICYKAALRRAARYQRTSALRGYVIACSFMLALFVAQAALCDERKELDRAAEGGQERVIANPHDVSGLRPSCPSCHTSAPPALSFDAVTTCVKCHSSNVDNHPVSRHPIGAKPKIPIPSFFPVSTDGRMVCYTCHDPHKKLKDGHRMMLRVDYQTLCAFCHVGY